MTHAISADAAALQQHIDTSKKPLLIDFTASWCGPCKGMAPGLEAFAQERADSLIVLKVDIDDNQAAAARFMVRSVPTLVLMQDGNVLGAKMGAMSRPQLAAFVDTHLSIPA